MSEEDMKRALVLSALLVALGAALAAPAGAADASPASAEHLVKLDQQILAGLNKSRAKHGLRPLVMSSDLQDAAVSHSKAMLEGGFFAHDSPGGATFVARVRSFYHSAGYNNWSVGENLLYSTGEVTADTAIAAWLASPGHRENMLMPEWREVGIGSLRANSAGGLFGGEATWVVTMDFGTRSGAVAKKAAPTKVKRSSKATAHPKVKRSQAAAKKQRAKLVKKKTRRATNAPKPTNSTRTKPVDRALPQPWHGSDDQNDDSTPDSTDPVADNPIADTSTEDDGVADDESSSDGSDAGGVDELAFRSSW